MENKLYKIADKVAQWSIYALILTLPFAKSIVEAAIVIALLAVITRKVACRERFIPNNPIDILLCCYILACALSFFNTEYFNLTLRAFFSKSVKFALLFLLAREAVNTREKLDGFISMALISCVTILLDAFIQYFVTHVDLLHLYPVFLYDFTNLYVKHNFLGFPTASFPYPNDFAAWIIIFIFPVGVYVMLGRLNIIKRIGLSVVFICLAYFLALTKVRGAWLGVFAGIGCMLFTKFRKWIAIAILIFVATIFVVNRPVLKEIISPTSVSDRGVMWKNGYEIFKQHPVIGNGLNTFFVHYAKVREDRDKGKGSYAHNCYLQMAAEIGLVGLSAFLLFAFAVVISGFMALKKIKDPFYYALILGANLGLIAFLVHSAVDTNLYSLNLAALFWVTAGILVSAIRMEGAAR